MPTAFPKKLQIFLCHAKDDKPKVRELYYRLKSSGYDVWFDDVSLLGGQEWKVEISKAIKSTDAIIFCLSTVSVAKEGYVQAEIKEALEIAKEKPEGSIFIVPLRLDDCIVPSSIQKWHFVNFFDDDGYKRLIKSLSARKKELEYKQSPKEIPETSKYEKQVVLKKTRQKTNKHLNSIVFPDVRLVYQLALQDISKENCRLIIDSLKARVAVHFGNSSDFEAQQRYSYYRLMTTSRPVEKWLQGVENNISKMKSRKIPAELWLVIGGYGSGKSHIKEFIFEATMQNPSVRFLDLEAAALLNSDLSQPAGADNIFSLILLKTIEYLNILYTNIHKGNTDQTLEASEFVKEKLKKHLADDEFIDILCKYEETRNDNLNDFRLLQELIVKRGRDLFLPLMKLYRRHLNVDGIFISIDEFESLEYLQPAKQQSFFDSIRALHDTMASMLPDPDLPSFEMVVLCTLGYWEEMMQKHSLYPLQTRSHIFEIPQLTEDEMITLAEKIYSLYRKSGYLQYEIVFDFAKIPQYLVRKAGIENPLSPRFVIYQIIDIIENPEKFIRS